ncbi:hypothetical protein C357_08091 [Citreicella sp. 357]|nr:hypothetical protein C357_08091 [Citreicella sp. 357]
MGSANWGAIWLTPIWIRRGTIHIERHIGFF